MYSKHFSPFLTWDPVKEMTLMTYRAVGPSPLTHPNGLRHSWIGVPSGGLDESPEFWIGFGQQTPALDRAGGFE